MSLFQKILYNALFGAWGGLLAWTILDLVLKLQPASVWLDAALNGALVGLCIGALVSSFSGLLERRPLLFLRGLVIGSFMGSVGGILGLLAGEVAFQAGRAFGQVAGAREIFRMLGWMLFGIGIGVAEGIAALSLRRLLLGGLGGIIGGLVGSSAFILIVQVSNLQLTNRAVGFTILGACIGFFAAWIPTLGVARLKVVASGPLEGKEFLLDKRVNTIGSAVQNDVVLYGNPTIAPRHAEIRQEGGQFVIHAQPGQPVAVGNAPATRGVLQNEDQVWVGNMRLVFRRRGK
jgi:hypothetical protein